MSDDPPSEGPPPRAWIAHYMFPDPDGAVATAERTIQAAGRTEAHERAALQAPADEFVLTLVPMTDEQFLGRVRQTAARLADDVPFDPLRYDVTADDGAGEP